MERKIKRGEVYIADLEPTVGSEQGGTRPVLIIQNDIGNKFSTTTIVAAITAREYKKFIPTHKKIACGILREESQLLLEQIRTIDKIRLGKYIGQISDSEMKMVDEIIALSLGLKLNQEVEE